MSGNMTLGDATEILGTGGWACACSGPVGRSSLCSCQLMMAEARNLHRGAHIAIKQIAEMAGRGAAARELPAARHHDANVTRLTPQARPEGREHPRRRPNDTHAHHAKEVRPA